MSDWSNYHVSDFARNIRGAFSDIPRFGHSRQIELLLSFSKRDQRNYIDGVVSFVILIIFLVAFWSLLLLYFRCRGTTRYGCLAGQFTYVDPKASSRGFFKRILVWILFLISGILVIVSPFVLIRSAYPKIHSAAIKTRTLNQVCCYNNLQGGQSDLLIVWFYLYAWIHMSYFFLPFPVHLWQSVKGLLTEGYAATNSTLSIENTLKATNLTQTNIRSYCGSSFNETAFLSSLDYNTTTGISFLTKQQQRRRLVDNTNVIDDIIQGGTSVQEYLNQSNTTQVRSLLGTGLNASKTVDHILHEFLDHDWIIKMFGLFLIAIVIIMIVLGLLNVFGKNPCFFHFILFWLILPSFILFIIFSWALAMLVTVGAVMNSGMCPSDCDFWCRFTCSIISYPIYIDVCFGGQNKTAVSTTLAALKLRGENNGILYKTILYYDSVSRFMSHFFISSSYP